MSDNVMVEDPLFSRHIDEYVSDNVGFDEFWDTRQGKVRAHWHGLVAQLRALPESDFRARQKLIHKQLEEIGVTYDVANDENRQAWELDHVPLVLEQQDWAFLNAGIAQRAKLLDRVLKDLYGARTLLTEGILPSDILLGAEQYLRPCHDLFEQQQQTLMFYAADITRSPSGNWVVVRDKTQMPTGVGYCLENRVAMSRVMSDEFSQAPIARLSGFFKVWHQSFKALVPHNDTPNVVMLSAGTKDETYFEHAYLAAYLGYNLVVGADLTVRDSKVWLKTLDGLQQVDVVVRWLEDGLCDSLELREDAVTGVPGLLHAAREGNVVVVNPIGAGVLENPGLMPFLPQICEFLLDEPLMLPQVESHWCGAAKNATHILEDLNAWVLKRTDTHHKNIYPANLNGAELEALRQQLTTEGHLYVAQAFIEFARTPTWSNGRLQAKPVKLRSFAVAQKDSYRVMPGALTRLVYYDPQFRDSLAFSGMVKDTWMPGDGEDQYKSLWSKATEQAIFRGQEQVTSRTGESLFWVGRNIERAENMVRLVRTVLSRLSEYSPHRQDDVLAHIANLISGLFVHHPQLETELNESQNTGRSAWWWLMRQFVFGTEYNGGLTATFGYFLTSAYHVRDYWSGDTWRIIDEINQAAKRIKDSKPTQSVSDMQDLLNELVDAVSAFVGHSAESLSRDGGWLMLETGRRIERAQQLINLTGTLLEDAQDLEMESQVLDSLLFAQESLTSHRRRYRIEQRIETVLELLLLNGDYPRSLCFQLLRLQQLTAEMPHNHNVVGMERHDKMILSALTRLQLSELADLATVSKDGKREDLKALLVDLNDDLNLFADAISQYYFSHTKAATQML